MSFVLWELRLVQMSIAQDVASEFPLDSVALEDESKYNILSDLAQRHGIPRVYSGADAVIVRLRLRIMIFFSTL